jgi:hypothetical protein
MRGSRTRKKNSAPRLVAGELSVQLIERTLQYRRFKAKHFSDATKTVACSDVKSETFPKTVRRLVVKDRKWTGLRRNWKLSKSLFNARRFCMSAKSFCIRRIYFDVGNLTTRLIF